MCDHQLPSRGRLGTGSEFVLTRNRRDDRTVQLWEETWHEETIVDRPDGGRIRRTRSGRRAPITNRVWTLLDLFFNLSQFIALIWLIGHLFVRFFVAEQTIDLSDHETLGVFIAIAVFVVATLSIMGVRMVRWFRKGRDSDDTRNN